MWKRNLLAVLVVFLTWTVMDFVIHAVILQGAYQATAELWRPEDEMKMGLMSFTVLVASFVFVSIYAWYVSEKNILTALQYGALFGVGLGVSMGYGTYAVMPIPYSLALSWLTGTLAETLVGGLLLGLILQGTSQPESAVGSAA